MAYASNPRLRSSANQSGGHLETAGEAASQSFLVGELVYKNTDGQWEACASDATTIWGIAKEAASGTQGTEITVQTIMPGDEVEMVCSTTVAATYEGAAFAIVVASNVHKLDLTDTTNDAFTLRRGVKDVFGAFTTRAICSILPGVAQAWTGGA